MENKQQETKEDERRRRENTEGMEIKHSLTGELMYFGGKVPSVPPAQAGLRALKAAPLLVSRCASGQTVERRESEY